MAEGDDAPRRLILDDLNGLCSITLWRQILAPMTTCAAVRSGPIKFAMTSSLQLRCHIRQIFFGLLAKFTASPDFGECHRRCLILINLSPLRG